MIHIWFVALKILLFRYCSKELIVTNDGQTLDLRQADIFSLGASVYEMCLGRLLGIIHFSYQFHLFSIFVCHLSCLLGDWVTNLLTNIISPH